MASVIACGLGRRTYNTVHKPTSHDQQQHVTCICAQFSVYVYRVRTIVLLLMSCMVILAIRPEYSC